MSDFLSNLISRTMTPAGTTPPRFEPMFAPPPPLVVERAWERGADELSGVERLGQVAEVDRRARSRAPWPAPGLERMQEAWNGEDHAGGIHARQNLMPPTVPRAMLTPARNQTTAQSSIDAVAAAARNPLSPPVSPQALKVSASPSPAPTVVDTSHDRNRLAEVQPERAAQPVSAAVKAASIEALNIIGPLASQRERNAAAGQTENAATMLPVPAPIGHHFEATRIPAAKSSLAPLPLSSFLERNSPPVAEENSSPPPQPGPIIRVNIGRIEVRAVTPPEPATRAQRPIPSPRLSLEEYLKQRQGGRR